MAFCTRDCYTGSYTGSQNNVKHKTLLRSDILAPLAVTAGLWRRAAERVTIAVFRDKAAIFLETPSVLAGFVTNPYQYRGNAFAVGHFDNHMLSSIVH